MSRKDVRTRRWLTGLGKEKEKRKTESDDRHREGCFVARREYMFSYKAERKERELVHNARRRLNKSLILIIIWRTNIIDTFYRYHRQPLFEQKFFRRKKHTTGFRL